MQNNVTIIIPIFNEEENIGILIDEIYNIFPYINILVVDDFSSDNSVSLVKKKINEYKKSLKISTKKINIDNKWLTYSIIKGILLVKTKYFIVMDWDFQHPIININNFLYNFKNWKDIVIWERKKIIFNEKKYRILISKIWNFLVNLKVMKNWFWLKDPLSWFFWWNVEIFKLIINNNINCFIWWWYKFLFEFLKLIKKDNFQIWYFNFNFWKRRFWYSKINKKVILYFINGLFK